MYVIVSNAVDVFKESEKPFLTQHESEGASMMETPCQAVELDGNVEVI